MRTLRDLETILSTGLLLKLSNIPPERFHAGRFDYEEATRLVFIFYTVYYLLGAYNCFGVQAWFEQKRKELGDKAPIEILEGAWNPNRGQIKRVMELAKSLAGQGGCKR